MKKITRNSSTKQKKKSNLLSSLKDFSQRNPGFRAIDSSQNMHGSLRSLLKLGIVITKDVNIAWKLQAEIQCIWCWHSNPDIYIELQHVFISFHPFYFYSNICFVYSKHLNAVTFGPGFRSISSSLLFFFLVPSIIFKHVKNHQHMQCHRIKPSNSFLWVFFFLHIFHPKFDVCVCVENINFHA